MEYWQIEDLVRQETAPPIVAYCLAKEESLPLDFGHRASVWNIIELESIPTDEGMLVNLVEQQHWGWLQDSDEFEDEYND